MYETKFIFNISKVGHIEDICVKSQYRNKGFGKLMVKHLVDLAKNNTCYKVVLECSEENSHFYEKCNFEKRGLQMSQLLNL
jgi:glucosamine-phosphate N-acetyltransferase